MAFFRYFLLVSFLLLCLNTKAQSLGKHASDIDWKSIETENVKVIYPEGTKAQADRIADVIEYIRKNKTISVGSKAKKIDVILQTQQSISNGFVTLSPFRSEFYAISPQDQSSLGSTDWLDLLSMHEYRHALQYANADTGLTKFLHVIAGENGWAAAQGLSIPAWYLEGDAVLIETLLSKNGRGRNPNFFKEQRSLFLEDKIYSYHKSRNGSFKDMVPNRYPLGFMISNHIRNHYDIETGRKILEDAGKYKGVFYPFSTAMKRHTGLTTTEMYKKSALDLQTKWKLETESIHLSDSELITKTNSKTVTSYTFPQYLNDGSIISIKSSYKVTPHIVNIKNGKETKLTNIGIAAEEYLSVSNDNITWTEHSKDLRHANKNYNNIVTYNYKSDVKHTITTKQRYFSPNFSYDGEKIAAVNYQDDITNRIDILNSKTGDIIESIPNPLNNYVITPKWSLDNQYIIYIVKKNSKLAFFKYSISEKTAIQLSDWTTNTIGQFSISKNNIYFTSSYSGIDNIYSVGLSGNKTLKKISSVKVGAYYPIVSKKEKKIIYSEFTSNGYKIHELLLKDNYSNFKETNLEASNYYDIKTTNIEHAILDSVPTNTFKESDYKGFLKGTKLHSWGITTTTASEDTYGAYVQFQNVLSNFTGYVSVLHNLNEGTNSLRANIGYGKGLLSWNLNTIIQDRNSYTTINQTPGILDFTESTIGAGFSIPLSQYKGNYSRSFNFETNYTQHITSNSKFITLGEIPVDELNFGAIESSLTLSNYRRTALQNLAPRFGQSININYSKSIDGTTAEKLSINTSFYFPGISKNHSLNIVANYQKELLSNTYQYSDTFRYSRGYYSFFNDEVTKVSINYQLPLVYPDFGAWGIVYFKRIRLNAFYDASILNSNSDYIPSNLNQNSYGGELIFDNIYFNVAPISLGLRQSMLLNTDLKDPDKTNAFGVFIQIGF